MEIEGKQILDTIYELYKTNSMIDFMKKSLPTVNFMKVKSESKLPNMRDDLK